MADSPLAVFQQLFNSYGPQNWWPGESPLEVMVGAVLTQNTAWSNVEKAIDNLRDAGLLQFDSLNAVSIEELAELIRPAGYYRQKAQRLRNFLDFITEAYQGSITEMVLGEKATLREQLLQVNGIGPETADSILLYAANLPSFVVDAYTARIFTRHGWVEPEADYHDLQAYFEDCLETDAQLFNEFHALIVRVGKEFCKPAPKCEKCPLHDMLPEGGPIEMDG